MDASFALHLVAFLRDPDAGFKNVEDTAAHLGIERSIAVAHPLRLVLRLLPERAAFHLARRFKYHDPHSTAYYGWPLLVGELIGEPTETDREKARIHSGDWPYGRPKSPHVAHWASGWQHAVYAAERGLACAYASKKRCYYESDCIAREDRERQWQIQLTIDTIELLSLNAKES